MADDLDAIRYASAYLLPVHPISGIVDGIDCWPIGLQREADALWGPPAATRAMDTDEPTDDCPDHVGGICEPYQRTPGVPAWKCEPRRIFGFRLPINNCPDPHHPGASLDCATT